MASHAGLWVMVAFALAVRLLIWGPSIADITDTEHFIFDTEDQCVAYGEHLGRADEIGARGLSCGIHGASLPVKASKVFSTPLTNANAAVMFSASNLMSPVGPLHRISTSHLVPTLTIDPMARLSLVINPLLMTQPMVDLLRLIARRTRQGLLVLKHGTEIPHFKPTAAGFTFPKMTGLTQRRAADWLADDFTARDRWRHTGDLDHSSSVSSINPWLSTTLPFCVIGT